MLQKNMMIPLFNGLESSDDEDSEEKTGDAESAYILTDDQIVQNIVISKNELGL